MRAIKTYDHMKRKKAANAIVAAITLVAFIVTTLGTDLALLRPLGFVGQAWAATTSPELTSVGSGRAGSPGASLSDIKELRVDTFSLPEYLGSIKDSWAPAVHTTQAAGRTTDPIIIHIQDAHCNYYCQQKITGIIEYLNKEYGIDTINLEGGAKDYNLSLFTDIKDKDTRDKVADHFVKQGLVNGAEYYAVTNPDKVKLWGIEDTKLYIDNLKVYRDSLSYKDEVDRYLKNIGYILSNLKAKIYSKELLEFDMQYAAYKAGNGDGYKGYLLYLMAKAKERAIEIKEYKNIYLLSQTFGEELKIDFKKANEERDRLIDKLQRRSSRELLEELVVRTVAFRQERLSTKDFYTYLLQKAKDLNIDISDSTEIQKYLVYVSMYDAVDKLAAMEEMERLEDAIKTSLYRSDSEKALSGLAKNLAIMKNIFAISLTKGDYEYYRKHQDSFDIRAYQRFIEKEAPLHGITATLDTGIARLDTYREKIAKFYEYSFKRDDAFIKNMKFGATSKKETKKDKRPAIIVTGGFHSENLYEQFRKKSIPYISIMPSFASCDGYECPYFRILGGKSYSKAAEKIRQSLAVSAMATASILNQLGGLVNGKEEDAAIAIEKALAMATGNKEGIAVKIGDKIIGYFDLEGTKITPAAAEEDRFVEVTVSGIADVEPGAPEEAVTIEAKDAGEALRIFSSLIEALNAEYEAAVEDDTTLTGDIGKKIATLRILQEYIGLKQKKLSDAIREKAGGRASDLQALNVAISYFRFCVDAKEIPLSSRISQAYKNAAEIAGSYFGLDLEADESLLMAAKAIEEAEGGIAKEDAIEKKKESVRARIGASARRSLTIMRSLVVSGPKFILGIASSIVMALLAPLALIMPSFLRSRFLSIMMTAIKFAQLPGASPNLFQRLLPPIMHLELYYDEATEPMLNPPLAVIKMYDRFDPSRDLFSRSSDTLTVYTPLRYRPLPGAPSADKRLETIQGLLETNVRHGVTCRVRVPDFRFPPKGETAPVPTLLDTDGKIAIPIECLQGDLYYDEQGNLYIKSERHAGKVFDLAIDFLIMDPATTRMSWPVFAEVNKNYFNTRRPLDEKMRTVPIELGSEVDALIARLQGSPISTKEKVAAVQEYLEEAYAYGKGLRAQLAIMVAAGRLPVEKTASCRIGNCYDVNKLAYVIVQRLGIAAELTNCIVPEDPQTEESGHYGIVEGRFGRVRGLATSKVKIAGGHAVLRYYDDELGRWGAIDMTPQEKPRPTRTDRREERMRREIEDLVATRGYKTEEEIQTEYNAVDSDVNGIKRYWWGIHPLSRQRDIVKERVLYLPSFELYADRIDSRGRSYYANIFPLPNYGNSVEGFLDSYESYEKTAPLLQGVYATLRKRFDSSSAPLEASVSEYLQRVGWSARLDFYNLFDRIDGVWNQESAPKKSLRGTVSAKDLTPFVIRWIIARYIEPPMLASPAVGWDRASGNYYLVRDGKRIKELGAHESAVRMIFEEQIEAWGARTDEIVANICDVLASMETAGDNSVDALEKALAQAVFDAEMESYSPMPDTIFTVLMNAVTGEAPVERVKGGLGEADFFRTPPHEPAATVRGTLMAGLGGMAAGVALCFGVGIGYKIAAAYLIIAATFTIATGINAYLVERRKGASRLDAFNGVIATRGTWNAPDWKITISPLLRGQIWAHELLHFVPLLRGSGLLPHLVIYPLQLVVAPIAAAIKRPLLSLALVAVAAAAWGVSPVIIITTGGIAMMIGITVYSIRRDEKSQKRQEDRFRQVPSALDDRLLEVFEREEAERSYYDAIERRKAMTVGFEDDGTPIKGRLSENDGSWAFRTPRSRKWNAISPGALLLLKSAGPSGTVTVLEKEYTLKGVGDAAALNLATEMNLATGGAMTTTEAVQAALLSGNRYGAMRRQKKEDKDILYIVHNGELLTYEYKRARNGVMAFHKYIDGRSVKEVPAAANYIEDFSYLYGRNAALAQAFFDLYGTSGIGAYERRLVAAMAEELTPVGERAWRTPLDLMDQSYPEVPLMPAAAWRYLAARKEYNKVHDDETRRRQTEFYKARRRLMEGVSHNPNIPWAPYFGSGDSAMNMLRDEQAVLEAFAYYEGIRRIRDGDKIQFADIPMQFAQDESGSFLVDVATGTRYWLHLGRNEIGQEGDSPPLRALCASHGEVSRKHAVITVTADGKGTIFDAGSLNGTYLNGERLLSIDSLRPSLSRTTSGSSRGTPSSAAAAAGAETISNEAAGDYILTQILAMGGYAHGKTRDERIRARMQALESMRSRDMAYTVGETYFIKIQGLFAHTGQLAHIGLGQTYGRTVVYIDADIADENEAVYPGIRSLRAKERVEKHELGEIAELRDAFGRRLHVASLAELPLRAWMAGHDEEAREIVTGCHNKANALPGANMNELAAQLGVALVRDNVEELVPRNSVLGAASPRGPPLAIDDILTIFRDPWDDAQRAHPDKAVEIAALKDATIRHSIIIARFALMDADASGIMLSPEERQALVIAALFHDLGKSVVADDIIKKERFTPEKREYVRHNHVLKTMALLFDVFAALEERGIALSSDQRTMIRDAIREHHNDDAAERTKLASLIYTADQILARIDAFRLHKENGQDLPETLKHTGATIDGMLAAAGDDPVYTLVLMTIKRKLAERDPQFVGIINDTAFPQGEALFLTETPAAAAKAQRGRKGQTAEKRLRQYLRGAGKKTFEMPLYDASFEETVKKAPTVATFYPQNRKGITAWEQHGRSGYMFANTGVSIEAECRVIHYANVTSPAGEDEGALLIYYDPRKHAIVLRMGGARGYERIFSGEDERRGDYGWDQARITIKLAKGGYDIERIEHETDKTEMGLSRTMIGIMLTDAGIPEKFPGLYDALAKFLVLRPVDNEMRERESKDNIAVPLTLVEKIKHDPQSATLPEIQQLKGFRYYKSWLVKRYALAALRELVAHGRITQASYDALEREFVEDDVHEDINFIRRFMVQNPALAVTVIKNVFGVTVKEGDITSVDVEWFNRGTLKNVYNKVTFTVKSGRKFSVACSTARSDPEGVENNQKQMNRVVKLWEKIAASPAGRRLVPRLALSWWYNDYRPRIADMVIGPPDLRGGMDTLRRQQWIYNNIQIIFREFVEGSDLDEIMEDDAIPAEEKREALRVALQTYCDFWNSTKKIVGKHLFIADPKPKNVVLVKDEKTGRYAGRLIDFDAMRVYEDFDDFVRTFRSYALYRDAEFEVMYRREKAVVVDTRAEAAPAPVTATASHPVSLEDTLAVFRGYLAAPDLDVDTLIQGVGDLAYWEEVLVGVDLEQYPREYVSLIPLKMAAAIGKLLKENEVRSDEEILQCAGNALVSYQVEALLKEDLTQLVIARDAIRDRRGRIRPVQYDRYREIRGRFLEKAQRINLALRGHLSRILPESGLVTDENIDEVYGAFKALNEEFLTRDDIGLYLEAAVLPNGSVFPVPHGISRKTVYFAEDGRKVEVLDLFCMVEAYLPLVPPVHMLPGSRFVCISLEATQHAADMVWSAQKGEGYNADIDPEWAMLNECADRAISKDFPRRGDLRNEDRIRLSLELRGLKANAFNHNGIRQRLEERAQSDTVEEALTTLTSLALAPATFYELFLVLDGISRPELYEASQFILNLLAEHFNLGMVCDSPENAVRIFDELMKKRRDVLRRAAQACYETLITPARVNSFGLYDRLAGGDMVEGAIRPALEHAAREGLVRVRDIPPSAPRASPLPPMGGGMSPTDLTRYAQRPDVSAEDLIKIMMEDGLARLQLDVVREALQGEAFAAKLREFNEKFTAAYEKVERTGIAIRSMEHGEALDIINTLVPAFGNLWLIIWSGNRALEEEINDCVNAIKTPEYANIEDYFKISFNKVLNEGGRASKDGALLSESAADYDEAIDGLGDKLRKFLEGIRGIHERHRNVIDADEEGLKAKFELVEEKLARAIAIVESRLEIARGEPALEPGSIREAVNEAVAAGQWGGDVEIHDELAGDVSIPMSRTSFVSAVYNIINNGVDFARKKERAGGPERAKVVVRLYEERDASGRRSVGIEIADNGPGLEKVLMDDGTFGIPINPITGRPAIFDINTTGRAGGTGLGTTEAWYVVADHGGTIDVASETGVGTTFTIRLIATENRVDFIVDDLTTFLAERLGITDIDRPTLKRLAALIYKAQHDAEGVRLVDRDALLTAIRDAGITIPGLDLEANIGALAMMGMGMVGPEEEIAPLVKGTPAEENEARRFLVNNKVDVKMLDRDFREIIEMYGYRPFRDLYIAAEHNAETLFTRGLLTLRSHFTPEELKKYWLDFVRLGVAARQEFANGLFERGLPTLKDLFQEKFERYWPDCFRLGVASDEWACFLFTEGIPTAKEWFEEDEFEQYWPDLIQMGMAIGIHAWLFFRDALPIIRSTRQFNPEYPHAVVGIFTAAERDIYWPTVVRLCVDAGRDAIYLFQYALPAVKKGLIDSADSLDSVGSDIILLCRAVGRDNLDSLRRGLTAVKKIFKNDFKKYWPDLVRLGLAAGEYAGYLFETGIPATRELCTEGEIGQYWPGIFRMGMAADKEMLSLFAQTLPALKGRVNPENFSDLERWVTIGEPIDKDICSEFLALSGAKRAEYFAKREEELQKIRSGGFDRDNPRHVMLGYGILLGKIRNDPALKKEISYAEYKEILATSGPEVVFDAKERAEIRYMCYEALKLLQFVQRLKESTSRPIVLVENLTYGWIATLPIEDDLAAMGIRIVKTKAGSTYAHDHPTVMHGLDPYHDDADLFQEADLEYIVKNEPIVVVVDGTYSLDPEKMVQLRRKNARLPDAHQAYRNYFHALSGHPEDTDFSIDGLRVGNGELLADKLAQTPAYKEVRGKADTIRPRKERGNYTMHFWYPGRRKSFVACSERVEREFPPEMTLCNPRDPDRPYLERIKGPTLIFAVANMEDEAIDEKVRVEGIPHNSAYLDDKDIFRRIFFATTPFGPEVSDAFVTLAKEECQRLKGLYGIQASPTRRPQVQAPQIVPVRAVIMDFDDTLIPFPDTLGGHPAVKQNLEALLAQGIPVAIITEEIEEKTETRLWAHIDKRLRKNLHVFSNGGTHYFGFNEKGEKVNYFTKAIEDELREKIVNTITSTLPPQSAQQELYRIDHRNYKVKISLKDRRLRRECADRLQDAFYKNGIYATVSFQGRHHINVFTWDKVSAARHFADNILKPRSIDLKDAIVMGNNVRSYGGDRGLFEALDTSIRINVGSASPTLRSDRVIHLHKQGYGAINNVLNNILRNDGNLNLAEMPPSLPPLSAPRTEGAHAPGYFGKHGVVTTGDIGTLSQAADIMMNLLAANALDLTASEFRIDDGTGTVRAITLSEDATIETIAEISGNGAIVKINRRRIDNILQTIATQYRTDANRVIILHELTEAFAMQLGRNRQEGHMAAMMAELYIIEYVPGLREAMASILVSRDEEEVRWWEDHETAAALYTEAPFTREQVEGGTATGAIRRALGDMNAVWPSPPVASLEAEHAIQAVARYRQSRLNRDGTLVLPVSGGRRVRTNTPEYLDHLIEDTREFSLDRVIDELLKNAYDACVRRMVGRPMESEEGLGPINTGRIGFSMSREGGNLVIRIRDNGGGKKTPPTSTDFRTFLGVDPGLLLGGQGIGIPLVKAAVLYHGGTVEWNSPSGYPEGFGTEVVVTLPVAAGAAAQRQAEPAYLKYGFMDGAKFRAMMTGLKDGAATTAEEAEIARFEGLIPQIQDAREMLRAVKKAKNARMIDSSEALRTVMKILTEAGVPSFVAVTNAVPGVGGSSLFPLGNLTKERWREDDDGMLTARHYYAVTKVAGEYIIIDLAAGRFMQNTVYDDDNLGIFIVPVKGLDRDAWPYAYGAPYGESVEMAMRDEYMKALADALSPKVPEPPLKPVLPKPLSEPQEMREMVIFGTHYSIPAAILDRIRPATVDDIPTVVKLADRLRNARLYGMRGQLEEAILKNHHVWVYADENGIVRGYLRMREVDLMGGNAWIEAFVTENELEGFGVSTALFATMFYDLEGIGIVAYGLDAKTEGGRKIAEYFGFTQAGLSEEGTPIYSFEAKRPGAPEDIGLRDSFAGPGGASWLDVPNREVTRAAALMQKGLHGEAFAILGRQVKEFDRIIGLDIDAMITRDAQFNRAIAEGLQQDVRRALAKNRTEEATGWKQWIWRMILVIGVTALLVFQGDTNRPPFAVENVAPLPTAASATPLGREIDRQVAARGTGVDFGGEPVLDDRSETIILDEEDAAALGAFVDEFARQLAAKMGADDTARRVLEEERRLIAGGPQPIKLRPQAELEAEAEREAAAREAAATQAAADAYRAAQPELGRIIGEDGKKLLLHEAQGTAIANTRVVFSDSRGTLYEASISRDGTVVTEEGLEPKPIPPERIANVVLSGLNGAEDSAGYGFCGSVNIEDMAGYVSALAASAGDDPAAQEALEDIRNGLERSIADAEGRENLTDFEGRLLDRQQTLLDHLDQAEREKAEKEAPTKETFVAPESSGSIMVAPPPGTTPALPPAGPTGMPGLSRDAAHEKALAEMRPKLLHALAGSPPRYSYIIGGEASERLSSPLDGLRSAADKLSRLENLNIAFSLSMGAEQAKAEIRSIFNLVTGKTTGKAVAKEAIHCAIAKSIIDLDEINHDVPFLAEILAETGKTYESVQRFLEDNSILDVINDKDKKTGAVVSTMPYDTAVLLAFARLNQASLIDRKRLEIEGERYAAELYANPEYQKALYLVSIPLSLLTAHDRAIVEALLTAEAKRDPLFFYNRRFDIDLPPAEAVDFERTRDEINAFIKVLRAA